MGVSTWHRAPERWGKEEKGKKNEGLRQRRVECPIMAHESRKMGTNLTA